MNRGIVVRAVSFALVAGVAFGGGIAVGKSSEVASVFAHLPLLSDGLDSTPDASVDFGDFWKAWNALETNFVQTHGSSTPPDSKRKLEGVIQGLAASYGDPYTTFFPPKEAQAFAESIAGNFSGIGTEIDVRDGVLTVVTPLKGTPAEAAGVKAGDVIVAIDGKSTEGISIEEAVTKIRGTKGTVVTLTIVREKKMLEIKVTRDTIIVPEIEEGLDPKSGVYHIALFQFTATSVNLFNEAFKNFKNSGSKLLVLDLRGNPGGYLESAIDMASHFLPEGTPVVTEDYKGKKENDVHRSYGYVDVPEGTKTVILLDQGSASASEILAGGLHDNKAATIIGTRSFGKGSVQRLIEIGGGSLKVTVARWLTPAGVNISDGGITPDIKVERTAADFAAKKDPQMDRAVQFLTTGK